MDKLEFYDKRGARVAPGDLIAYSYALGRSAALKFGKVLAVKRSKNYAGDITLRVASVADDCNDKWTRWNDGTLWFGSRVLVIPRELVHPDAIAILDAVEVPNG